MLRHGFRVASFVALVVAGVLASNGFEDYLRQEFGHGIIFPRATQLASFFSGDLGGAATPPITESTDPTRPFEVDGDTFPDFPSAAGRACDNQHNTCAELSNNKTGKFPVSECDTQSDQCNSAISSATQTSFSGSTASQSASASLFSSNSEFDFFCEQ